MKNNFYHLPIFRRGVETFEHIKGLECVEKMAHLVRDVGDHLEQCVGLGGCV